ncbi:alpha-amylase family glycosyl hydrolase [Algoriphagus hitonicola]|uniref:Por secretion system C-terminal sorting domain-containing protein n=1 Tax=Algoriphagus hitonicola TaxID=435880 RepID=A0A1I2WVF7_9BACT|nr:alpha-amylase family glycosyl hydrolase [Algoriphagus hitonicola]SFH05232.1 Por secretion system C-terminal sorting domain-containing protein [Algoriphagus hitonicola]
MFFPEPDSPLSNAMMKKTLSRIFFALGLLWSSSLFAQVSTEPSVPNASAPVKIIYDASEGTTGLEDCNCDVYIHIGAVTEGPESTTWSIVPFEWGQDIPEAKMTKVEGEDNIYTFELTPDDFFENPNGQTIYRLGMVFRNVDGTREGKTSSNSDFFVDLSQGFGVQITDPSGPSLSLEVGEGYSVKAETSEEAEISFELDGEQVATVASSTSLTYDFVATEPGSFRLEAIATAGGETDTQSLDIVVFGASQIEELPAGARLGINYISDTEVILALQAPGKKLAHVIGDFNDWEVLPEYQMNRTPDGEIFWLRIENLVPQQEYIFQYLVDASIRIGDPYADKTSDPFNDQEIITQGRYPGLKPFPAGKTNFQATYLQTAQEPFEWQNTNYEKPAPENLVVYELLVRDFDEERTYQAVIDRLDYLEELGVNAIELMPVGEFEGNLSWGYNPSFFFAPDKYYGTKNDLKRLIDAAHGKGMVVILDMVLNHAFGQNPMVRLYNDGDYGAPTEDNPWFNRVAKHPFNVGYDFNHESEYTREFVDSVNNYWLTEYKVDGFRFDLSKGFTQVNSGDNVNFWSQYDPSRIAIWKHIYDQIKANHPDAYVILEHLAANDEEKELADYGLMFWGNMNGDFRELAKGENRSFNWAYHGERDWNEPNLIAYQESHDEERVMWESLNFGNTSLLNIRELENAINRNQLLTAFFFAVPGPKMLWQFGEFGYDEELNNDRLGIKPTRWEYLDDPQRNRLFQLYKEMIHLRTAHQVFSNPEEVVLTLSGNVKSIILEHADMDVVIHGNFGLSNAGNVPLAFPSTGTWYNYFTGEEFNVTGSTVNFNLRPSEFYLFTNERLPTPERGILQEDFVTSIPREPVNSSEFAVYPNPSSGQLFVQLPKGMNEANYRIIDMTGKEVKEGQTTTDNQILEFDLGNIKAGLYIFEAFDTRRVLHQRFIKN